MGDEDVDVVAEGDSGDVEDEDDEEEDGHDDVGEGDGVGDVFLRDLAAKETHF